MDVSNINQIAYLPILSENPWLAFIVFFVIFSILITGLLIIFFKILRSLVKKTKTMLDDRIVNILNSYLTKIGVTTSLWLAMEITYPGILLFRNFNAFDIYILIMLGIGGLLVSKLADLMLLWYGLEIRQQKKSVKEREVYPFVRNVVRIAIVVLFAVFILQRLGFDTTAIITGLGIGGLAVALALQDTLANFFAGVHILVDKPFKQRDYIKLENGTEGRIKQIGWRTTRLSTISKDEIVVPNAKLASSTIINYSSPMDETGVLYTIGVSTKEDIDKVEKIIADTIEKVSKETELIIDRSIWVRFDSFGDYTLNFKFGYLVKGYTNQWSVLKQLNRSLFYAFKKNKIAIPFPAMRIIKEK